MERPDGGPIVLFDGVCKLCNGVVRFVAANDPAERIRFMPLQSSADGTFVLLADGRRYERSDAVLYLALHLRAPWPLAFAAILIPRRWRDALYRFVARNRYRWFGKRDVPG